jgi:bifunctional non-homologous end joining protein LigD
LGLLDAAGNVIPVGNVTVPTGRAKPDVDSLIEVQYLYAYKGGSLYQPVLIGPRTDINRDECTLEQLKFKNVPA